MILLPGDIKQFLSMMLALDCMRPKTTDVQWKPKNKNLEEWNERPTNINPSYPEKSVSRETDLLLITQELYSSCIGLTSAIMDPSIVSAMDKDALKKQIENMKYQAQMERWPLSKSIAA